MLKVVEGLTYGNWMIVLAEYGEIRKDKNGREYTYLPLPLARVPYGAGRTEQQARELADIICGLLEGSSEWSVCP